MPGVGMDSRSHGYPTSTEGPTTFGEEMNYLLNGI
jgi:hypothetical protein